MSTAVEERTYTYVVGEMVFCYDKDRGRPRAAMFRGYSGKSSCYVQPQGHKRWELVSLDVIKPWKAKNAQLRSQWKHPPPAAPPPRPVASQSKPLSPPTPSNPPEVPTMDTMTLIETAPPTAAPEAPTKKTSDPWIMFAPRAKLVWSNGGAAWAHKWIPLMKETLPLALKYPKEKTADGAASRVASSGGERHKVLKGDKPRAMRLSEVEKYLATGTLPPVEAEKPQPPKAKDVKPKVAAPAKEAKPITGTGDLAKAFEKLRKHTIEEVEAECMRLDETKHRLRAEAEIRLILERQRLGI